MHLSRVLPASLACAISSAALAELPQRITLAVPLPTFGPSESSSVVCSPVAVTGMSGADIGGDDNPHRGPAAVGVIASVPHRWVTAMYLRVRFAPDGTVQLAHGLTAAKGGYSWGVDSTYEVLSLSPDAFIGIDSAHGDNLPMSTLALNRGNGTAVSTVSTPHYGSPFPRAYTTFYTCAPER